MASCGLKPRALTSSGLSVDLYLHQAQRQRLLRIISWSPASWTPTPSFDMRLIRRSRYPTSHTSKHSTVDEAQCHLASELLMLVIRMQSSPDDPAVRHDNVQETIQNANRPLLCVRVLCRRATSGLIRGHLICYVDPVQVFVEQFLAMGDTQRCLFLLPSSSVPPASCDNRLGTCQ